MRPAPSPAIASLILLITLLLTTLSPANQLREMEYEFITSHSHNVPRADDVAFLFIESTITDLVFDTNNVILERSMPDPGLYRLRLRPGTHILTAKADGFVPLSGIRLSAERKRTYALRISPKTPQIRFDPAGRRIGGEALGWDPLIVPQHVVVFESEPPGAEVRIDGEYLCQTPCSRPLPEGEHRIEMRLARHADHHETITITEPMTLRSTLIPLFGWVSVQTEPAGLTVELNGKPIGKSPIIRHEVDPGLHTVKVVDPRYRVDGVEDFQITGNQHRELPVLRPVARQGVIHVQAVTADNEQNALSKRIKIGDQVVGNTPWRSLLLIGMHDVTVGEETRTVTIKEFEPTDIVFHIQKLELPSTPPKDANTPTNNTLKRDRKRLYFGVSAQLLHIDGTKYTTMDDIHEEVYEYLGEPFNNNRLLAIKPNIGLKISNYFHINAGYSLFQTKHADYFGGDYSATFEWKMKSISIMAQIYPIPSKTYFFILGGVERIIAEYMDRIDLYYESDEYRESFKATGLVYGAGFQVQVSPSSLLLGFLGKSHTTYYNQDNYTNEMGDENLIESKLNLGGFLVEIGIRFNVGM